jgi:hypothetical protein
MLVLNKNELRQLFGRAPCEMSFAQMFEHVLVSRGARLGGSDDPRLYFYWRGWKSRMAVQ